MKKTIKAIVAIVMVATLMLAATACGVDLSKMKGDWTVTKANDTAFVDYAASIGGTADTLFLNFTITDKDATLTGVAGSQTYTYKQKANGIDLYTGDTLAGAIELKSDGTLAYAADLGAGAVTCIFEKGTYTPAAAEETPVDEATPADEEVADDEIADEEVADDEIADEEVADDEIADEEVAAE